MKNKRTTLLSILALTTALIPINAFALCTTTGSDPYTPSSGDVVVCDGHKGSARGWGGSIFDIREDSISIEYNNGEITNKERATSGFDLSNSSYNSITLNNSIINTEHLSAKGITIEYGSNYNEINILNSSSNLFAHSPLVGTHYFSKNNVITIDNSKINVYASSIYQPLNIWGGTSVAHAIRLNSGESEYNTYNIINGTEIVSNDTAAYINERANNNTINVDDSTIITKNSSFLYSGSIGGNNYSLGNSLNIRNGSYVEGLYSIKVSDDSNLNVELNGTGKPVELLGTSGSAIDFGNLDDVLTVKGDVIIDGDVTAGGGTNTLNLNDALLILKDSKFTGFDNVNIYGDFSLNLEGESGINRNIHASGNSDSLKLTNTSLELDSFYLTGFENIDIKGKVILSGNVDGDSSFDTLSFTNVDLTLNSSRFSGFENINLTGSNIINNDFDLGSSSIDLDYGDSLDVKGSLTVNLNMIADRIEITNNEIKGIRSDNQTKLVNSGDNFANTTFNLGDGNSVMDIMINQDIDNIQSIQNNEIKFSNWDDVLRLGNVKLLGDIDAKDGVDSLYFFGSSITVDGKLTGFENVDLQGNIIFNGDLDILDNKIEFDTNEHLTINGDFIGDIDLNSKTILSDGDTIIGVEGNNSFTYTGAGFELKFEEGASIVGNSTFNRDLTIGNNAFIAPGNSVGVINVVGNTTLGAGSVYNAEFDKSGADLVATTGNAIINPAAVLNILPINNQYSGGDLSIINAGGAVTGRFGTVNFNHDYMGLDIVYGPASVNLQYVTPSALSAQAISTAQTGLKFNEIIAKQSIKDKNGDKNNFWMESVYSSKRKSYDENSFYNSFNNNVYGVAFGSGASYNNDIYIGYAVADLKSDLRIDDGEGKGNNNGVFASIYSNYYSKINNNMNSILTTALTLGFEDTDYDRTVLLNTGIASAKSDSNNFKLGGLIQFALNSNSVNAFTINPKFGMSYMHVFANGYTESNVGNAGVTISDYNYGAVSPFMSVDLRPSKAIQIGKGLQLKPNLELGINGEFITGDKTADGIFSNTGTSFNLPISRQSAIFGTAKAGVEFNISDNALGSLSFEQKIAKDDHSSSVNFGIRVPFN